jgi:hypothetical protein
MVPEDLAVWLEAVDPSTLGDVRPGLLCTRHADAMVVPKGWTLDDRREPTPRLFRIPQRPAAPSRPSDNTARLRRPRPEDWARLALFDEAAPVPEDVPVADVPVDDELLADVPVEDDLLADVPVADVPVAESGPEREPVAGSAEPWRPQFDQSDDLDGLLTARSPLLRRAFGLPEGDDGRPR